jgi:hypothetical protein
VLNLASGNETKCVGLDRTARMAPVPEPAKRTDMKTLIESSVWHSNMTKAFRNLHVVPLTPQVQSGMTRRYSAYSSP